MEDNIFADQYIAHYLKKTETGHHIADWTELDETLLYYINNNPHKALSIIRLIIEKAPSEKLIYYVAAGPLEDLLNYNGEKIINDLIEIARPNPKFRLALGGVWKSKIKETVWSKVQKYAIQEGETAFET